MGRAIRTERYRLVQWEPHSVGKTEYELYDYEKDPLETINFADSKPDVLPRMIKLLDREPTAKKQVEKRRR